MERKGFFSRLKILSRPTGSVQWIPALKAILLMIVAVVIAKFLGWDNGLGAIMFLTLIATMIMDIPLPIRKIVPFLIIGFSVSLLAFICSSIALTSLPAFILLTALWTFFSFSIYIFGESVGAIGYVTFLLYFLSVLMVNRNVTPLDWVFYIILAFLVASLVLIPKILKGKKYLREMIASGFHPQTSLTNVLATRQALSGIPLDQSEYDLFSMGTYLSTFRSYGNLLKSRLSGEYLKLLGNFMNSANQTSSIIAESIIKNPKNINLSDLDQQLAILDQQTEKSGEKYEALVELAHQIRDILGQASELLDRGIVKGDKIRITNPNSSYREIFRANFNLDNVYIRHAIRFALAMTIALLLVRLTHERTAIWITMGVLMIMKPDVTSTINNLIARVPVNFIAIIIAIILGFLFPHQILFWLGFIMIFFFRAFFPNYMSLSVMALTLFIVFIWPTGTVYDNAVARMIDVSIGAAIAFACAYLILPSRMTDSLPDKVSKTIQANMEFAQKIFLTKSEDYNHQEATKKFRNYIQAENNLEAAIKKMQDTFNDIEEDVSTYQEITAANNKLAADIVVLATSLEKNGFSGIDLSLLQDSIKNILSELVNTVEEGIKPTSKKNYISNFMKEDAALGNKNLYLGWIASDLKYLTEVIEIGLESGALKRYKELK